MARARRWILRGVIGLVGLLLVLVIAALLVLANLDAGPIKSIIQSQARKQGIALDFADGAVTWGGVHLEDVRIASPTADATIAPHLIRIGSIDGKWSPLSKRVDDLVIRDVTLTVVVDPDGTTSFDRWLAGMPPRPPPPVVPLSQSLEGVIPEGIAARARLEDVKLRILRRAPQGQEMLPIITVAGFAAGAVLEHGRAALTLGPSDVALTVGDRAAVARLDGGVTAGGRKASVKLALSLIKQELAPELPKVAQLVDLGAGIEFKPGEQRTTVSLDRLALLDGAVRADALVDLRDTAGGGAAPTIEKATCRIDAVAVARALPKELGPIAVEADGPVSCAIEGLTLSPPRGKLTLAGKFPRVVYQDVTVSGLGLDVEAQPDGDALAARVHLPVDKVTMPDLAVAAVDVQLAARTDAAQSGGGFPLHFDGEVAVGSAEMPGQTVRGAKVKLSGTAQSTQRLSAKAHVALERVAAAAELAGVDLDIELGDVVLAEPATASTGDVKLRGTIAAVAQPRGVRADGVKLDSHFELGGARPTAGGLTVEAAHLTVPGLDDFRGQRMTLATDLSDVNIDHQAPARSSGRADLHLAYGAATAFGRVEGSAADLRWDLEGNAARLGPANALAFKSKGSYGRTIVQETTVDVGRVAAAGTALKSGHVAISSSGTMRRQEAKIAAALEGLSVNGKGVGSPKLDVTIAGDLDKPRVELGLKGTQPDSDLTLFAEIDARRTVTWKIDGRFARLGALAPLLPAGPDYAQLGLRVKGGGAIAGVVRRVVNGVPELVADPATRARGRSSLELTVQNLGYKGAAETVADAGEITLKADATLGERRVVTVDLAVPDLAAVASGVHVAVKGLTARIDAALEKNGRADARLAVRVGSLKQSAFAPYPVEELAIDAQLKGDPKADLSFTATVDNAGAGTRIAVSGQTDQRLQAALDAVPGRRSLAVDGKIEQRLDKLDAAPELIRARGNVEIPFRVESGDLVLFNTRATVKLAGVSLEMPGSKLAVRDAQGSLPIFEEIVMGPNGAEMVGRGERGVYPQLRFSDQQPFLGIDNYLSIAEVTYGTTKLGPLAGNMRLDRDVLALDQLELNALGGKATGQALVEVRGKDTRVAFRGKVTGVRPSAGRAQGERLDANAAFTIAPYRLGLEGRVEIVELGKAHLYDLLDLWDPYHADVSANRVRLGLKLGYPKQVRLKFLHGFASLAVELGGLAGAVRIDEIKGIAIGPALARFLAPLLETTP